MTGDDEDKKQPYLRLAVENDRQAIDKEYARRGIDWPLRDLAANMIRVVRGAGKSYEIVRQCSSVLKAFQNYHETTGHWPTSYEIEEILSIDQAPRENETYDEHWQRESARDRILRGSLQVAVSRLVGQSTQEQRGRTELMDGVWEFERIREERRERVAAEEKARSKALREASAKSRSRRKTAARATKA